MKNRKYKDEAGPRGKANDPAKRIGVYDAETTPGMEGKRGNASAVHHNYSWICAVGIALAIVGGFVHRSNTSAPPANGKLPTSAQQRITESANKSEKQPPKMAPAPPTPKAVLDKKGWPTAQNLEWKVMSVTPRVYVRDDFLSAEESDHLRMLAEGRLVPAMVVQKKENKYDTQTALRNNKQVWLTYAEEKDNPLLRHILKRMHRTAHIPDDDAEALQIGQYGVGEKYELHQDSDPRSDVPRPATMVIFLNDVEAGGHILFPRGSKDRGQCGYKWHMQPDGSKSFGVRGCCERDHPDMLRVQAKKGRAVLFFNHLLDGQKDVLAEHAACPVLAGEKWIAQRWFRFAPYQRIVHPPDWRFDGPVPDSVVTHLDNGMAPGHLDLRVLSNKNPRLYLIEDLLSENETQHFLSISPTIREFEHADGGPSRRWILRGDEEKDPVIVEVVKRMHRVALVPEAHAEPMQLTVYAGGESLQLHVDSDPKRGIRRPYTLLVYLDGDGLSNAGATVFPVRKAHLTSDALCGETEEPGVVKIKPKAGRAVLIASHHLDGKLDPTSAHMACPAPPSGKQVLQRWFTHMPSNDIKHPLDPAHDGPHVANNVKEVLSIAR